MTVAELIKKLETQDPTGEVKVFGPHAAEPVVVLAASDGDVLLSREADADAWAAGGDRTIL